MRGLTFRAPRKIYVKQSNTEIFEDIGSYNELTCKFQSISPLHLTKWYNILSLKLQGILITVQNGAEDRR